MRIRTKLAAAAGLAVAAATGIAVAALAAPAAQEQAAPQEQVLLAHGSDHLPSTTATDWVTYADHVVVVEAVSETAIMPDQEELDRGEGIIGRTVTLAVDEVLWSREGAAQAAPETWEFSALGWHFRDGDVDGAVEMGLDGFPRVEVGHRYVMAIRWEEAVCTAGGDSLPAMWRGLGEGSEIPFDGGTLGNGESEGTVQDAAAFATDQNAHVDVGVEEILVGEGADELVAALEDAKPDEAALSEVQALTAANSCE
ncbi:hypothetical protein [Glycomyces sp. MUSA5-2]|uniref:hypothetical protein n=1 Tax=Glycomyces sp. MUSA5-2 TaxID=2053002 RepID=UPI0030088ACE